MMVATNARSIITLTTDFGLADGYVAAMKGVALAINADATIIDVTHAVRPGAVRQAAFITQTTWPFFPEDAIHVAVVDPGVGTERRAVALETPSGRFIGPDNGVLSAALPDEARPSGSAPATIALPDGYRAVAITNETYLRTPVSATFHGRDVFAPAAAHLSLGVPIEALGEPIDAMMAHPAIRAQRRPDGALDAQVVHVDRFGNVVLDVRSEDLPEGPFVVELAGRCVTGPVRTYAGAANLCALVGSSGYLEVALPGGSAAEALAVDIGASAVVRAR